MITDWHPWFAWFPVRVDGRWAWLQRIERWAHNFFVDIAWEYRMAPPTPNEQEAPK